MEKDIKENPKMLPTEIIIILGTLSVYIILRGVLNPQNEITGTILIIMSALIAFELIYFVWKEIKEGVKKHGWKHEAIDTLIAVIVAILMWVGASVVLNTSTPISAVVSCSMLPNLERGDFIVVQGADVKAYEINMSASEIESLVSGPIIAITNEGNYTLPMPLYPYCNCYKTEPLCMQFKNDPRSVIERTGPFMYHYTVCEAKFHDREIREYPICLEYVEYNGVRYYQNISNDVIVYTPQKSDLFANVGDIVHRAFFKINVNGKEYYLTKGDNNPMFDIQQIGYCNMPELRNHPVPQENVKGRVIGRVPYLGYLKLFIAGQWKEDSQCNWQLFYTIVQ